jgi:hypothetical protein
MGVAILHNSNFHQRFGSSLNLHLHYHCVVIDGIFYEDAHAVRLLYDVSKNSQQTQPPLNLTATKLLDKLAHLIPPRRRHRHRYHGVLAPFILMRKAPYSLQIFIT